MTKVTEFYGEGFEHDMSDEEWRRARKDVAEWVAKAQEALEASRIIAVHLGASQSAADQLAGLLESLMASSFMRGFDKACDMKREQEGRPDE